MDHLNGLLDVFEKTPTEFAIFVQNRSDKSGTKWYMKIDYKVGGRYDDINYLISSCLTATGMPPTMNYLLKDTWDNTLVLHSGIFYPGIILTFVKKIGNKDLTDFFMNVRQSLRYNYNKIDDKQRLHQMEADSDNHLRKVQSFGTAVAHSPLRLGLKPRGN